jgi:hypothetical protein
MTRYDKIKDFELDDMATFIFGIIEGTEERILSSLSALGIDVSLCSLSTELRVAQIKRDLLEEDDD